LNKSSEIPFKSFIFSATFMNELNHFHPIQRNCG
jgi:hypothetical protein